MTDRFKGVLVTFDREISEDDAKKYFDTIRMIKGVNQVKPYVNNAEDWMMYEKGYHDATMNFYDWVRNGMKEKTPPE
jgi:hypothetical protein